MLINASPNLGQKSSPNSSFCPTTTSYVEKRPVCCVCGDESDGLHFGQYTCRACAAFFRRSVSLKLHYVCKKDRRCKIEKSARNMCRACRFQHCLEKGMLTSAVQHSRDGLGKRKESKKPDSPSSSSLSSPQEKKVSSQQQQSLAEYLIPPFSSTTTTASIVADKDFIVRTLDYQQQQQQQQQVLFGANPALMISQRQNPVLFTTTPASVTNLGNNAGGALSPGTILQLNGHAYTNPKPPESSANIVGNFSQLHLGSSTSAFNLINPPKSEASEASFPSGSKHLSRMVQGYKQFLTLRKAGYTLVEGLSYLRRSGDTVASLIMDVIEKYFYPFSELPKDDRNKLFDDFYCLFSNVERCFRTYVTFEEGDERIIMPDGGYVRLSELEKFYENNSLVRGDPVQMAKIFEDAMKYKLRVSSHMRRLSLTEVELVVLFGMFIWSDAEVSPVVSNIVIQLRDEIIVDLHLYYRSEGYSESEITLRTANLFLLIPKIETLVRVIRENFSIAELFNMLNSDGISMCCEK